MSFGGTYETFEADGFTWDFPTTFDAGSGISTLVGNSPSVAARLDSRPFTKVTGTVSNITATKATGNLAPWSMAPGTWKVQVQLDPPSADPQTISDFILIVKTSAAAAP